MRPFRVCLITPPSIFLLDERVFMTLGILRVAAVLEQSGVIVEMLDLSGIENFLDAVRDHATQSTACHFGLTATTPQMPAVAKICDVLRCVRPDARLILGGPHITLIAAAMKCEQKTRQPGRAHKAFAGLQDMFDVLVAGDGEIAIFPALEEDAPWFIDADDPKTDLFIGKNELDQFPMPARHLIDVGSYHYFIDQVRALSLISQLGCPFSCGFCGGRQSAMLRRVRIRSIESVVDEIVFLHETYDVNGFMFYDDELNVNSKMTELMNRLAGIQTERDRIFRLRGFIKSELFTDQQAAAMYRAGFRWILVGFESGSPRILQNINKKATREDNTRCIEIAHRHGLKVKALMSVGHPGESRETILDTERWLLAVRPDDFDVTIITTYPGTPYYDFAIPHGDRAGVWTYTHDRTGDRLHSIEVDYTRVADYYKGDPDGGYQSFVFTDFLSCDELVALRDQMEHNLRRDLNIPFNPGAPALHYEHTMGQMGQLPDHILRKSF